MASSKDRQRALARAKAERQIARRAIAARRRRRWQAAITGVLTLTVLGLGVTWAAGGFEGEKESPSQCAWTTSADATNPDLQDVGKPPARGNPTSGTKTMAIALNQGAVEVQLDLAKVPCGAASFTYLAGKKFFDGTKCHRLVTGLFYALQCGDPKGTGRGGPTYTFNDENLPTATATPGASANPSGGTAASSPAAAVPSGSASASPEASGAKTYNYSRGTVAFFNNGPNTNGSQFLIFFQDSPAVSSQYSVVGTVTKGIEVVEGIGKVGVADNNGVPASDGAPKNDVTITSLTVGSVQPATPASPTTPAPPAETSPSAPAASGTASTSASAKP